MTTKTLPIGAALDVAAASLPYGFLEALADHGEKALSAWLRENTPEHVAELFDSLMAVKVRTAALRAGNGQARTDSSLLEWVAEIARGADLLGVQWTGPAGEIYAPGKVTIADDTASDLQADDDTTGEPVAA